MITKFHIFERKYINYGKNKFCPVCGSIGKHQTTVKADPYKHEFYGCPTCEFRWISKYRVRHESGGQIYYYDLFLGAYPNDKKITNKIEKGKEIDPSLYNDLGIETNKYNL